MMPHLPAPPIGGFGKGRQLNVIFSCLLAFHQVNTQQHSLPHSPSCSYVFTNDTSPVFGEVGTATRVEVMVEVFVGETPTMV